MVPVNSGTANTARLPPIDRPVRKLVELAPRKDMRAEWKCRSGNTSPDDFLAGASRWPQKQRKPSRSETKYRVLPLADQQGSCANVLPSVMGIHSAAGTGRLRSTGAIHTCVVCVGWLTEWNATHFPSGERLPPERVTSGPGRGASLIV